jgi:hypothetical protein
MASLRECYICGIESYGEHDYCNECRKSMRDEQNPQED